MHIECSIINDTSMVSSPMQLLNKLNTTLQFSNDEYIEHWIVILYSQFFHFYLRWWKRVWLPLP